MDEFEHACHARIAAERIHHPFRALPKPVIPLDLMPDDAIVTGVYRFATKPRRVTLTTI